MSKRSVTHSIFTLERTYDASPARVFRAWADPAAKARWFGSSDGWRTEEYKLDFQVGGQEVYRGAPEGGDEVHAFNGHYQDIVPDQRIVYTYDMHLGGKRISVSLATVELEAAGKGTRLTFTEQGAFLDGFDRPDVREQGTGSLLDALAAELRSQLART